MAFLALFLAYPLFYNLWTSVHDVRLSALLGEGGRFTGLDNYRAVTDDPGFWHSMRLSVIFTLGSLVFQFGVGFALALLFARPVPLNDLLPRRKAVPADGGRPRLHPRSMFHSIGADDLDLHE